MFMKNRYNSPPVVPDFTPKGKKKESTGEVVVLKSCLACGKEITDGYWGAYKEGGVCSKSCNIKYQ
jgi:hypothetical protein